MPTVGVFGDHASWWSAATWVVTGGGSVALSWIMLSGVEQPAGASMLLLTSLATVVSYGGAGAVLIDRRPDLLFGWLLAGVAASQAVATPVTLLAFNGWQNGHTGAWVAIGAATTAVVFLPVAVQGLINVRFPSGRVESRAWRWLERAILVGTVASVLGGVFVAVAISGTSPTDATSGFLGDAPPDTTIGRIGRVLQMAVPVVILLGLVAGIGVVIRYRRAVGIERRQLALRAAGVIGALLLFPFAVSEMMPGWIDAIDPLLFVVTLAVPVLRYRLWAIDTLIRRSVVYLAVSLALAVAFVGLTVAGAAILSDRVSASVAAVVIALSFAPLRGRVQALVDRVAYGGRRDPYRTLSDLDHRLAEIAAPGEVLPVIVDTISGSLRLPYVAIERIDGSPITVHGHPGSLVERWRLVHEGTQEGFLVASPRRGEDQFDERDRDLLADVARHAGVAVHAELLTADLIASRQRIVAAREEERRRLRRDLHDGLGPTLTGIGLKLDAARSQLRTDPDVAGQLIRDAKAATSEAIADVRRLVYGLRPPSLDNLGLVGAIEHHARQLSTNGCCVTLRASDIPELPAAIEVAAYRAVVEAVTNSIRHGHARSCTVCLEARVRVLEIDVADDGIASAPWTPGVGLLSMREQAAELGGTVDAGPDPAGGARVHVHYPIATVDA